MHLQISSVNCKSGEMSYTELLTLQILIFLFARTNFLYSFFRFPHISVSDKGWPLTTKDGESKINKYQTNGHQQKGQNLRLPSDSRSTQSVNTSQNVDERKLKIEPADIDSSFKHDRGLSTIRIEQIEYTQLLEKVDELHQLEIQCATLKSEKEQMANLCSSQATEHKILKQEYEALRTEYDRLKSEKQQETNSRMLQQTEYQKLVKQYDDLFSRHNQLQEQYSAQQSEKEQLHAKCLKLETDTRELQLKCSSAKSPGGSACKYFNLRLLDSTHLVFLTDRVLLVSTYCLLSEATGNKSLIPQIHCFQQYINGNNYE